MTGHRNRAAVVLVSVAILGALALLVAALRGTDWEEVARLVRHADVLYLVLAAAMSSTALWVRSLRWRVLLNVEGDVTCRTAFWATAAGYLGNNFLPARAGEILRTVLVTSSSLLSVPYVLATVIAERALDAVFLLGIGSFALLAIPGPVGWWIEAAKPLALVAALVLLSIAVLPRLDRQAAALVERAPLPTSIQAKVALLIGQMARGLRSLHDLCRLAAFAALTGVIWGIDAGATIVGASALGLGMPVAAALLLLAALGLGSALPSTPGYVGIYQFAAVLALMPFGFSRADAIAYILVAQAVSFLVIGCWGGLALWHFRTARRRGATASRLRPANAPGPR